MMFARRRQLRAAQLGYVWRRGARDLIRTQPPPPLQPPPARARANTPNASFRQPLSPRRLPADAPLGHPSAARLVADPPPARRRRRREPPAPPPLPPCLPLPPVQRGRDGPSRPRGGQRSLGAAQDGGARAAAEEHAGAGAGRARGEEGEAGEGRMSHRPRDSPRLDHLASKPDAEYESAFRPFDVDWFDNFLEIYNKHRGDDALPFDWSSEWASLYIGCKNKRHTMV
ncbi:Calcium-binding EF-hand [Lasiodiplodia theobromae]|uniref:Calcium-binding EF-hand n=1 Tax=Lasiodiplodia theobromae TaxID=45133 RepID=A0A8H7IQ84_9PEZI|nr:Calcium-binding EF-hand [Lasiodiplodia theobromae]